MQHIEDFQQKSWLDRLRRDFNHRYAYGFEPKDREDVFSGIVADVLVIKLPNVALAELNDPPAYVLGMFRNRAVDYFRHHHKRHRPPKQLNSLEEPYPQIFYEFCLAGLYPEVIATKLKLALEEVTYWVQWLQEEQRCPSTLKPLSLEEMGGAQSLADIPEYQAQQTLSSVEEAYRDAVNKTLAHWILGRSHHPGASANGGGSSATTKAEPAQDNASQATDNLHQDVIHWLQKLNSLPPLSLQADDVLLLKMLYLDDCKIAEAGQVLSMKDHQVTYRRDKVLKTIRAYMMRHGIKFDD